uniref:Plant SNARE 13 n=1 Tax=Rhizophora mucronata TaxID=61149 RepID=A0A2P2MMP6_RHIMU
MLPTCYRNGFQRLDKVKDSNRQGKQLEELTGRMRECKRLIKEFDREIKDEESRNPPEVNKQLNDEKQSMIKELNSYVALRKTYMSTLGNKRVELFDMGAGGSEPTAEENVQMASAMSNQELITAGTKTMDETDQVIQRSKQVVAQTIEVGTQTAVTLKGQVRMSHSHFGVTAIVFLSPRMIHCFDLELVRLIKWDG